MFSQTADNNGVAVVDFHPTNNWIAIASAGSNEILVQNFVDEETIYSLEFDSLSPSLTSLTYLNDGRYLAFSDWQGQMTVWDFETDSVVFSQTFSEQVLLDISQDEHYLTLRSANHVDIWRCQLSD
jgi:WD40 repeat protein